MERYREKHEEIQNITQEKIDKLSKFKEEYEELRRTLITLPNKLSHAIMVPITKVAFMPGRLTRTNEVLVQLGESWFAEVSARNASGIATRRIKAIDQQLGDLQKEKDLISPRLTYSTDQIDSKDEVVEIIEEYDEEKEKKWRAQHKEYLRKHPVQNRLVQASVQAAAAAAARGGGDTTTTSSSSSSSAVAAPVAAAKVDWNLLEQRELEDELRQTSIGAATEASETATTNTAATTAAKKSVHWQDEQVKSAVYPDDVDEEEDDYSDCSSLTDETDEEDEEAVDRYMEMKRIADMNMQEFLLMREEAEKRVNSNETAPAAVPTHIPAAVSSTIVEHSIVGETPENQRPSVGIDSSQSRAPAQPSGYQVKKSKFRQSRK